MASRTREPLRSIGVNTPPAPRTPGGLVKQQPATPGSNSKPQTSVLSGGPKRVRVLGPSSVSEPVVNVVTPKKLATGQPQSTGKEHIPGYLHGTQSIKSVPLNGYTKPSAPKPTPTSAKRAASVAAPHSAPHASRTTMMSPRSSAHLSKKLFPEAGNKASASRTQSTKPPKPTVASTFGSAARATSIPINSPARGPAAVGTRKPLPYSTAKSLARPATKEATSGRERAKSTGPSSGHKSARQHPAVPRQGKTVAKATSQLSPTPGGPRAPVVSPSKNPRSASIGTTYVSANKRVNPKTSPPATQPTVIVPPSTQTELLLQCSPIVRNVPSDINTDDCDETQSVASVSSSILRSGIAHILGKETPVSPGQAAKSSAFCYLPVYRSRSVDNSQCGGDDASVGAVSLDSRGVPKVSPVVQLSPTKQNQMYAPGQKCRKAVFSPINFQYEQPGFAESLHPIAEVSNGSHNNSSSDLNETARNEGVLRNGNASFLSVEQSSSDMIDTSAVLDDSGECISTIAPTPSSVPAVLPYLDETISVCASTVVRDTADENGSDGPASAAEDEASEQQIGTLKSIDENDGDEDYILNDDMTVTSDLTNFTTDFTSVLDTSNAPPPPLSRSRSATTTSVPSYLESSRPEPISIAATNRRDVISLGRSVNFDGISPLASNGGTTPVIFGTSAANRRQQSQLSLSMSSTGAFNILTRVPSTGSNADASFAASECSQQADVMNTAMRLSDQSALNLMRSLLTQSPIPPSSLPSPMSVSSLQGVVNSSTRPRPISSRSLSPMVSAPDVIHEGRDENELNTSMCSTASSDSCLSNAVLNKPDETTVSSVLPITRPDYPPRQPYPQSGAMAATLKSRGIQVDEAAGQSICQTPPPTTRDCDPVARAFMLYQSPARGADATAAPSTECSKKV